MERPSPGSGDQRLTVIRAAEPEDLDVILELNTQWERVTSPLTAGSLKHLHEQAAYHRVLETEAGIAAFLIALGPGADYASPNYLWFDAGSPDFLYIDRIVVHTVHQGRRFGMAMYDDLVTYARQHGVPRLVCEVDLEPFNEVSDAFHARYGFVEVGTQWTTNGTKRVSLKEYAIS